MNTGSIIKRGVVLSPNDFSWDGWMEHIQQAGLNYLGLHSSLDALLSFLRSWKGEAVLAAAARAGIDVNFELHVLSDLLPKDLFETNPQFFRMAEDSHRTAEGNPCVANPSGLSIIQENACKVAEELRPFWDINRYYFWPHDNRPWCHCPSCRELSYSDQCLIFTNAVSAALREMQPDAQVAYLAYTMTIDAPSRTQPTKGVFLQYAPIYRSYEYALGDPDCDDNRLHVQTLQALCGFFGTDNGEVLEYWLDVSKFSGWRRPAVPLSFSREILSHDVALYAKLGFTRLSTFGVWIDREYVEQFGEPPLGEYGRALSALSVGQEIPYTVSEK